MISFSILISCLLDGVRILKGEVISQSLMGVKELIFFLPFPPFSVILCACPLLSFTEEREDELRLEVDWIAVRIIFQHLF